MRRLTVVCGLGARYRGRVIRLYLVFMCFASWFVCSDSTAQVPPLPGEVNIVPPPPAEPPKEEPNVTREPMRFSLAGDSAGSAYTLYVQKGVTKLGLGNILGDGYFEPLCHGPCEFTLRPGVHVFAVSKEDGRTIKLDRGLRIKRGQELVVRYRSRRVHRVVGWALLAGLVGSGVALYALAEPGPGDREGEFHKGYVIGGSVLVMSGLLSGLWMANLPDKATGWVTQ